MKNTALITALPVGEFETEAIRNEFEAITAAFYRLSVDLVIADPVSDVDGANQSVRKLLEREPDLLVIIPLRGASAPVIETAARISQVPCLIWPVQGRFALPSSTLAVGALRESGFPVELNYAPPDNPGSIERIQCFINAAKAFSRIRKSRIGVIGDLFPNLVSCRYNPQTIGLKLGITILPISFNKVCTSVQSIADRTGEIEQARQDITSTYSVKASDESALDSGLRLHLALKQIALEHKIDGFATECWTGFPKELGLNPCLGFLEDAYTLACEGDVMLCIALLTVRYITGSSAYVGDLYDLDLDGILTLVHCGGPASLASNKKDVVLAKSQLAIERSFETITCRPQMNPGPVTLFRFYGQNCDKMHISVGKLLYSELSPNLMVKIRLTGDRWDFLAQCFGNHYVVVPGDIRNELSLLCKWLGITIFNT